ncbi:MAG: hypothetical protein ABI629_13775 [bacterium]
MTLAANLGHSAPPYPLRVATAWSAAARHAATAFSRLVLYLAPGGSEAHQAGDASPLGWTHFAQIVEKMRDTLAARGIPFVVTLLPNRQALERPDGDLPGAQAGRRIAAITAQLGIPTLDAWNLFADAVRRDGTGRYFLGAQDVHFSADGHRLVADWLAPQLALQLPSGAAAAGRAFDPPSAP